MPKKRLGAVNDFSQSVELTSRDALNLSSLQFHLLLVSDDSYHFLVPYGLRRNDYVIKFTVIELER